MLMYREVSEDMNAVDRYGNTALHYAANGRRGIVNLLLSQTNCDVTIRNVDNQTAADIAHAQRLYDIANSVEIQHSQAKNIWRYFQKFSAFSRTVVAA